MNTPDRDVSRGEEYQKDLQRTPLWYGYVRNPETQFIAHSGGFDEAEVLVKQLLGGELPKGERRFLLVEDPAINRRLTEIFGHERRAVRVLNAQTAVTFPDAIVLSARWIKGSIHYTVPNTPESRMQ